MSPKELKELAFTQSAVGIAVSDTEGRILEVNSQCEILLGYSADELKEHSFFDLTHPDDRSETESLVRELREGVIPKYEIEKRYITKSGQVVWSNTRVCILRDADGLPRGMVGVLEDISSKKRYERLLKETQLELSIHQARLESVIRYSEDAIITKNLYGVIQSWNPAAERIFGYTAAEAVGRSIYMIIPPELQGEEVQILAKISRGERVEHLDTERITKDGRRRIISVTSSPVKDLDGNIVGATKIARDVTDQRHRQVELEQNEARYRALAEERSALLVRESKARMEVEQANQVKDQFLATLSHELRTPLNAILGWAQLATRKNSTLEQMREALKVIERNGKSQAQIIEDLLDMNRIVSGTLRLEKQNIDLLGVIEEAIETVAPAANAKEITIEKLYAEGRCSIIADPNRIKQVIWNLLTNAVKFSEKGSVILVSTRLFDSKVEVKVSDSGEGISSDFLPYVFDRFTQADTSSTRKFGGLGLGLSIVRHLVELHGGNITAQSEGKGKGAVFTVTLPLSVFAYSTPEEIQRVSDNLFGGIRILLVDDEHDARQLLKVLLQVHGAEVSEASSSAEGVRCFEAHTFDVIISDIGMPLEDGYQFIKKIRAHSSSGKNTPAIALTAYARMEDRIRALSAGYQMHIAKPVDPMELIAVIKSITGKA